MKKGKLFLVLTTGRAGSSATAGALHYLGVNMGDELLPASETNPKGHFEDADFFKINCKILNSVNANWATPISLKTINNSTFPRNELISFLAKKEKPVWGLKDPRTTHTFELWKPYFEEIANVTYVFAWRPQKECVKSLVHGYHMDLNSAEEIVQHLYTNLQHYRETLEKENCDVIDNNFHDFLEKPETFVKQINQRINNEEYKNISVVKAFLDKKLKHF